MGMYLSTDRTGRVSAHNSQKDAQCAAFERGGKAFDLSGTELTPVDPKAQKKADIAALTAGKTS